MDSTNANSSELSRRPVTNFNLSLLLLPVDVIFHCIVPYLRKGDQYQLLSTCTVCKPWLLQTRTLYIAGFIPDMNDLMENKKSSMNVYLLNNFLKCDQHQLLSAVGSGGRNNNVRKIRLDVSFDKLLKHTQKVLDIAEHLSHLTIKLNEDNNPHKEYCLPMRFDDPTALGIKRWLKSAWLKTSLQDKTSLQIVDEHIAKMKIELGEIVQNKHLTTWNDLRGVNKVVVTESRCYVELGADLDAKLQASTFDNCEFMVEVPSVRMITLINCPNISKVDLLANAVKVDLERLTIADLRMLGGVEQLIIKNCKVVHYPIPTSGKGQTWEFSSVDIADVSTMQSLEKLTLSNCNNVKDGSMLGNVQSLSLEGGNMEHYPVPKTGKRQYWILRNVCIANLSQMASLEGLTLIRCNQVTDISMLVAVRYLTIESCDNLLLSEQYPNPSGRLQEWTFNYMNMEKVCFTMFARLHQLLLFKCTVKRFDKLLTEGIFRNVQGCAINSQSINNDVYFCIIGGKLMFIDFFTLETAVLFWSEHKVCAKRIYGNIEKWDVSRVKDMACLFSRSSKFNSNINAWDVSNVAIMDWMFYGASSFNQPLASWNVSRVTDMSNMFQEASSFNQPLNSWNVSQVTAMRGMFQATSFNRSLNSWNVSMVTDMSYMFNEASSFNQPLDSWNVSKVTDMSYMFKAASSFNQPLDSWDVSNVTNMSYMFDGASAFNQTLESWNVSKVTYKSNIFHGASSFNKPLDSVRKVV